MPCYAVALMSSLDERNRIFFINATTPVFAIKKALIEQHEDQLTRNAQLGWNKLLPNTLDELITELREAECACGIREIPKK